MRWQTLLVGVHFRPPAKQVLAHLPSGTRLVLEEDNENEYDPAAVKVFVETEAIPESEYEALTEELPAFGVTFEQLMSTGPVWLGFIPASDGKPLAKARAAGEPGLVGNREVREVMPGCKTELAFGPDGNPRVIITEGSGE